MKARRSWAEVIQTLREHKCQPRLQYPAKLNYHTWRNQGIPRKHKIWYIYTLDNYLAIKNNEFMKFFSKWMYLEDIILSEVTQSQKKLT